MTLGRWNRLVDVATLAAAMAAVAVAGAFVWRSTIGDSPAALTRPNRQIADWRAIAEPGRWLGPRDAPVVIIEFGDYQCPSCRGIAPEIMAIRQAYPEDVAVVYRHWPLPYHHFAYPAARAAECAGDQGLFEPFHDWLYEDSEWLAGPRHRFVAFAVRLGVPNVERFEQCLDSLDPHPAIERDIAAAKMIEARGTPTIIVNGTLLGTAADSATLASFVEKLTLDPGS